MMEEADEAIFNATFGVGNDQTVPAPNREPAPERTAGFSYT